MKVIRKVGEGLVFEFEADSPRLIFERLALLDGLFRQAACGLCGGSDLAYVKREIDNGFYLELQCQSRTCGARLCYGQNKDGKSIFVKDWDKEAHAPMQNRGWHIYRRQEDSSEQAPPASNQPQRRPEDIPF